MELEFTCADITITEAKNNATLRIRLLFLWTPCPSAGVISAIATINACCHWFLDLSHSSMNRFIPGLISSLKTTFRGLSKTNG